MVPVMGKQEAVLRSRCVEALGLSLLLGAGCGGAEAPLEMRLGVAQAGLLDRVVELCPGLYPGPPLCEIVSASAQPALFMDRVPVDEPQPTLHGLPDGRYTAAVWGVDADGAPVAFGCTTPVKVEAGERVELELVLDAYPYPERGRPCEPR